VACWSSLAHDRIRLRAPRGHGRRAGCGIWLYGKLDDAAFRRIILILLLASSLSLVVSALLRAA
jgi:hypothetical protein